MGHAGRQAAFRPEQAANQIVATRSSREWRSGFRACTWERRARPPKSFLPGVRRRRSSRTCGISGLSTGRRERIRAQRTALGRAIPSKFPGQEVLSRLGDPAIATALYQKSLAPRPEDSLATPSRCTDRPKNALWKE